MLEEHHDFTIDLSESTDLAFMMSLTPTQFTQVSQPARVSVGSGRAQILQADVVHEVGHALGFAHEHQRVDRNSYVTKKEAYQQAESSGQQVKRDISFVPFGSYDTNSVMHYPGLFNDKSTNRGIGVDKNGKTLFPDNPSKGDIFAARFLYNEARIKEYIEKTYDNTTQALYSCAQDLRLNALSKNIDSSIDVTQRTYDAVQSQMGQLECLSLDITALDGNLASWAEEPITQRQAEIEAPKRERAGLRVSTNRSSFHRSSTQGASNHGERTVWKSRQDFCRIS